MKPNLKTPSFAWNLDCQCCKENRDHIEKLILELQQLQKHRSRQYVFISEILGENQHDEKER